MSSILCIFNKYNFVFLLLILSIVLRGFGVAIFLSEGIALSAVFFLGFNRLNMLLVLLLGIISLVRTVLNQNFSSPFYDLWGIAILLILTHRIKIDIGRFGRLIDVSVMLVYAMCVIKYIVSPPSLFVRDGLIFEGPLALGFYISSAFLFYFITYKGRGLIFRTIMLLPLIIVCGGRHPVFVIVVTLFLYIVIELKIGLVARYASLFLIIIILGMFIANIYEINLSEVRAINPVPESDTERLGRWSELYDLHTFSSIMLGMGRDMVGSIGARAHGSAAIIESSYGTYIYSYGLLGLIVLLVGYLHAISRVFTVRRIEPRYMAALITTLIEPIISQRFETPSIMLLYFIVLIYILNYHTKVMSDNIAI